MSSRNATPQLRHDRKLAVVDTLDARTEHLLCETNILDNLPYAVWLDAGGLIRPIHRPVERDVELDDPRAQRDDHRHPYKTAVVVRESDPDSRRYLTSPSDVEEDPFPHTLDNREVHLIGLGRIRARTMQHGVERRPEDIYRVRHLRYRRHARR